MSTIPFLLNLVGGGASLIVLGRAMALYYDNYRRKMIAYAVTLLLTHTTLALVFSTQSIVWPIVSFGMFGVSFLRFLSLSSIGGIPREYKWPYLTISLLTALLSLMFIR